MYNKNEIQENIILAAKELIIEGVGKLDIYIGGSSSISLAIENFRGTMDIDIVSSLESKKIRKILKKYQINDDVATSVNPNLREEYGFYKKNSILYYKLEEIKFFIIWPEVTILAKAFLSDRKKDIEDIKTVRGKLNIHKLDLAGESLIEYRKQSHYLDPHEKEIKATVRNLKEQNESSKL